MTTSQTPFRKGHGTGTDFILVSGLDGLEVSPKQAISLCDRHLGIGANGILRVARASDFAGEFDVAAANYFMDYTNADNVKNQKSRCQKKLKELVFDLINK